MIWGWVGDRVSAGGRKNAKPVEAKYKLLRVRMGW